MNKLIYKSNLKAKKMPAWLTCILNITLDGINKNNVLEDTPEEFEYIRWMLDEDLKQLQANSDVTTELVTDEGQSVIFIKRSGRVLASIYYQESNG